MDKDYKIMEDGVFVLFHVLFSLVFFKKITFAYRTQKQIKYG